MSQLPIDTGLRIQTLVALMFSYLQVVLAGAGALRRARLLAAVINYGQ